MGGIALCQVAVGIHAAFVAGDEVYGGRELRRGIRQREMGSRSPSPYNASATPVQIWTRR